MTSSATIVITSFNRGAFLREALESAIQQDYEHLDIMLVDDGSTDSLTLEVVDAARNLPRVRVYKQPNRGPAVARNVGIRLSRADVIVCLDDDDLLAPSYVSKVVRNLDEDPSVGVVYSLARKFGAVDQPWNLPPFSVEAMVRGNVVFAAAAFRRADWLAVGGYSEDLRTFQDYDFWLKLLTLGRDFYRIPEELFFYRVGHVSMMRRDDPSSVEADHEVMRQIMRNNLPFFRQHVWQLYDAWLDCSAELGSYRRNFGGIDRIAGVQIRSLLRAVRYVRGIQVGRLHHQSRSGR